MFWDCVFMIAFTFGTVASIANMSRKETFIEKLFHLVLASAELFMAVSFIFKFYFTALGGF